MVYLCDQSFSNAVCDLTDRFNMVSSNTDDPIAERTKLLKQIVDSLADMATDAVNFSRANPWFLNDAILQTQHIMDVLGDDDYSLGLELVRQGLLDPLPDGVESIWGNLGDHINTQLAALRLSLTAMIERESAMVIAAQRKGQQPQRLTR